MAFRGVVNRQKARVLAQTLAGRFSAQQTSETAAVAANGVVGIGGRLYDSAGVSGDSGAVAVVNSGRPANATYTPAQGAAVSSSLLGGSGGGGGGGSGMAAHDLSGAYHSGVLADAQAPQFLKFDGSRPLTGNLAVYAGITIDGVDLSAHAANANAHHNTATAGDGISLSGQQISLASSVAGAGLGYAAGVLAVGAGLGLTVNADDVALTTPGTLTVATANASTGSHTHAVTSSSAPGAAASLLASDASGYLTLVKLTASTKITTPLIDTASGDLTLSPVGVVKLADGKTIQSDNFATGFTGNGWRITEAASVTDAEVDNLSVRGLMRVYELLIHKIRTGNGSYLFANGGKVTAVSGAGPYTLDFDEDHGLATNDLLLAQKFTGSGTYQSKLTVTGTPTTKQITATLYSGAAPAAGYEYVRIGNSSDANRRGSVYITADDSGAPFVDVLDGVAAHTDWYSATKIKARLGKLDGMTYAGGSISGYGLYSDNVYLSGRLRAGGGVARADDNGFAVTVAASVTYNDLNAYTMERADGSTLGGMYGWESGTSAAVDVRATAANSAHTAATGLYAYNSAAGTVQAQVSATASDGSAAITLTKGQAYLATALGVANKALTLTSTGLDLPSPVGIGTAHNAAYGLLLSGRQYISANGRTETYSTLGLEIVTSDNTPPGIGFHRSGYSAVALYERGRKLFTRADMGVETQLVDTAGAAFAGSVGIGISPSYPLHVSSSVYGDVAALIRNTNSSGYGLRIVNGNDSNPAFYVQNSTDTVPRHLFYGSGNAHLALGAGTVGIGTESPASGAKLHVVGEAHAVPTSTTDDGFVMNMPSGSGGYAFDIFYNSEARGRWKAWAEENTLELNPLYAGSYGAAVVIQRNAGSTTAPGSLALTNKDGTVFYLWVDTSNKLRIHTARPTNSDTGGSVVGSQS